LLAGRG